MGLVNCHFSYTQDRDSIASDYTRLKEEVDGATGKQRLQLLDSLSRLMYSNKALEYEPFVERTIAAALRLDSVQLGIYHATELVGYMALETGRLAQATEKFHEFESKFPPDEHLAELGYFYAEGAATYFMAGRFEEGLPYAKEVHRLALKTQDSTLLVLAKEDLGHAFAMMGDFQKAAAEFAGVIQINERIKPEGIASAKRELAILYSQNGLQEEAKKLRQEAINVSKSLGDNSLTYTLFYDQAFDEMLHGSLKERLRYLDSAAVYNKELTKEYYVYELAIAQLGAYSESGMLSEATAVKERLEERLKGKSPAKYPEYNLAMAQYEFLRGNYTKAAALGELEYEALKDSKFYEGIYMVNKFLSKVYERLGNQKRAFETLSIYNKIKDSLESVQKANGFSYYQTLLETEKKEAKIAVQESEIELLDARNKSKSQLILIGGLGLLLVFIFTILAVSQRFNRKKRKLQTEYFT